MAYVIAPAEEVTVPGLPLEVTLSDGSSGVLMQVFRKPAYKSIIAQVRDILNGEIETGRTYPQEFTLNEQGFFDYYLSHDAFVVVNLDKHKSTSSAQRAPSSDPLSSNPTVMAAFYVKPNFPGRSNHICNGGFLVHRDYRRRGLGRLMAYAFFRLAPSLGYRAAMFNLVYLPNVGSVELWRRLGVPELSRIPMAGRVVRRDGCVEFHDAQQFFVDFHHLVPPQRYLRKSMCSLQRAVLHAGKHHPAAVIAVDVTHKARILLRSSSTNAQLSHPAAVYHPTHPCAVRQSAVVPTVQKSEGKSAGSPQQTQSSEGGEGPEGVSVCAVNQSGQPERSHLRANAWRPLHT